MKTMMIILALALLCSGCLATAGVNIPDQDIVIGVKTELGFVAVGIPKGYLNPDQEGKSWFPIEDYKKMIEKQKGDNI